MYWAHVSVLALLIVGCGVNGMLLLCTHTCTYNGQIFCGHIPCPLPPCDKPLVLTPGDCCQHCPNNTQASGSMLSSVLDPTIPLTTSCPSTCLQDGQRLCQPIPCRPSPCNDAVHTPGDCCPHCPNGPNCVWEGRVVPVGHVGDTTGQQCKCVEGNDHGGKFECIYV